MTSSSSSSRDLDLVLVGATGFVGRLTAAHLAEHAPEGARIALAGRSRERLDAVATELGGRAADWERILVDVSDPAACADLAARTRVVVTTVGPYVRYGHELVKACAVAGTHYADLTGEVLFVRDTAEGLHEVARRSGARIVPSCGFDSVPSDLGVWLTADQAARDGAGELTDTTLYVRSLRGGISGGTIDSMREQAKAARASSENRRTIADPYGLSPDRAAEPSSRRTQEDGSGTGATRDTGTPARPDQGTLASLRRVVGKATRALPVSRGKDGHWTGPFIMASYNTRVVRRSNALLGWRYGRDFRYREVTDFGTSRLAPVQASGMTAGLLALVGGMSTSPTRAVLDRVLPAPGEGPSEEAQRKGRFRMEIVAGTTSGVRYRTTVAAQKDPGYSGTAVMLGEAGLCLALDDLESEGGVLTPAVAMARPLTERLRAKGFTLETSRDAATG